MNDATLLQVRSDLIDALLHLEQECVERGLIKNRAVMTRRERREKEREAR